MNYIILIIKLAIKIMRINLNKKQMNKLIKQIKKLIINKILINL